MHIFYTSIIFNKLGKKLIPSFLKRSTFENLTVPSENSMKEILNV